MTGGADSEALLWLLGIVIDVDWLFITEDDEEVAAEEDSAGDSAIAGVNRVVLDLLSNFIFTLSVKRVWKLLGLFGC